LDLNASSLWLGYRGPVRAAIFDWAGTVLDFGCLAPVEAFREVFAIVDVPVTDEELRLPMGAAKREHIEQILAMPDVQARWRQRHGAFLSPNDVDLLYGEFLRIDERNVAKHSDLIPGALDTIAALRARDIRIGSTTGYPREVMKNLAPIAEQKGYRPDHCCTVSDVARGRPWPDMCLANALALEVPDVRACVVVDDSPSGLAAGRAAGMWAIGVVASGNEVGLSLADWQKLDGAQQLKRTEPARRRLLQAGAHHVIDTIADLLPVIETIEKKLTAGEVP
jgi:phosphonoacetaldehyde hydrolase